MYTKNLWSPAFCMTANRKCASLGRPPGSFLSFAASFIPDRTQSELRDSVSYCKSLVQEKNQKLNRLQKLLEGANIKLSGTVLNINGKIARAILDVLAYSGRLGAENTMHWLLRKKLSVLRRPKNRSWRMPMAWSPRSNRK